MPELVKMSDAFGGLPLEDLIGGPLQAACKAQSMMASATADFINEIGLEWEKSSTGSEVTSTGALKTVNFSFKRAVEGGDNGGSKLETVDMSVPLLSIVKIPTLSIDSVDISFDMEVKSSTSEKNSVKSSTDHESTTKVGMGFFRAFSTEIKIKGNVSTNKENTRKSDNSAKYHVEVKASQGSTPEGLSRMLDILASTISPSAQDKGTQEQKQEQKQ